MRMSHYEPLPPVTPPSGFESLEALMMRLWWTPAHLELAQVLGMPRPVVQFRHVSAAAGRYFWLETAAVNTWWSHWLLINDSVRPPIAFVPRSASNFVADHELREVLGWDAGVLEVVEQHFNFPRREMRRVADADGNARSVTGRDAIELDAWLANVRALLAPVTERPRGE